MKKEPFILTRLDVRNLAQNLGLRFTESKIFTVHSQSGELLYSSAKLGQVYIWLCEQIPKKPVAFIEQMENDPRWMANRSVVDLTKAKF